MIDNVKDVLEQASRHTVLPARRMGNTLIVAPAGDINGYSRKDVDSELTRVQSLLQGDGITNLILDLGHAPYFGSEMIGMFVSLRKRIAADGTIVFCEPSSDMRMILDKMRITTLIPMYDTRAAAMKAVVRTTWRDRLKPLLKLLWVVVAAAVVGLAWWLFTQTTLFSRWIGTSESRVYDTTVALYHEVLDMSPHKPTVKQWKTTSAKIDAALFPVVEDLKQRQDGSASHKALFSAVQRFWSGTRTRTSPSAAALAKMRKELEAARNALQQETGLTLPAPRSTPDPNATPPRKSPLEGQPSTTRRE